ncbi:hypothetical protein Thermo_02072 [Thermoplasmatales archaeon]|nr:hypothetical protein Thermo_02072 [Thermoplasmatales archaeon]
MNAFNRILARMDGEPDDEGEFNGKGILILLTYAALAIVETLALNMMLPV